MYPAPGCLTKRPPEAIMAKRRIDTNAGAQPIGAYSQGVRAGDFIFVSGQGPLDPQSGMSAGLHVSG
jgi:2-iminobutanoate/2-iminopropanoate deaminase